MNLMTYKITADEYKEYWSEDLNNALANTDNESNKVSAWLNRVCDEVETYLASYCFKRVISLYPNLSDYQKECYKKALLYQAKYKIENGDINTDAGYDLEKGIIVSRETLIDITLSPMTLDLLRVCGLLNRSIF